jgi:hypothetical protein
MENILFILCMREVGLASAKLSSPFGRKSQFYASLYMS